MSKRGARAAPSDEVEPRRSILELDHRPAKAVPAAWVATVDRLNAGLFKGFTVIAFSARRVSEWPDDWQYDALAIAVDRNRTRVLARPTGVGRAKATYNMSIHMYTAETGRISAYLGSRR